MNIFASFTLNPQLREASRLGRVTSSQGSISLLEWGILLSCGAMAAIASALLDFSLRIPGHAILRVVFPMTLGLALVPRRGAGALMSCTALMTMILLRFSGTVTEYSLGATTSLIATGPLLDFLTRRTTTAGHWIYFNCAFAGLLSNSLALAARGSAKFFGFERLGKTPFEVWIVKASLTYPVCGLIAGLICAAMMFSVRHQKTGQSEADS